MAHKKHKNVIDNYENLYPMVSLIDESKTIYVIEKLEIHLHTSQIKLLKEAKKHSKAHHKRARTKQYQKLLKEPVKKPASRPARTPEAREKQLISLAYDLAEERLREGTATSAEVVHFLKLGSLKERQELELNKKKMELMTAKTEALQSAKKVEELYGAAIEAMRRYSGVGIDAEFDDEEYE